MRLKLNGENEKLDKRILATLCVTIFILGTLATVSQVSAHYTLGSQKVTPGIGETLTSAPGVVAPGATPEQLSGGLPVTDEGAGNGFLRFHPPDAGGHHLGHIAFVQPGSLYIPPSDQPNYYSPEGAILTESVGDLFFYICLSDDTTSQGGPINDQDRVGPTSSQLQGLPGIGPSCDSKRPCSSR